ncbi:MAG: hypothetical protein LBT46_00210 [Planctomycetaceae bacterium]|jgi:hypothetical protein|nr:hypothetical protein [Planctomycetaceae bacterium]
MKLWDKIKGCRMNWIASDYWRSYEEFVPPEQHWQTKAETDTAAGFYRVSQCENKSVQNNDISVSQSPQAAHLADKTRLCYTKQVKGQLGYGTSPLCYG